MRPDFLAATGVLRRVGSGVDGSYSKSGSVFLGSVFWMSFSTFLSACWLRWDTNVMATPLEPARPVLPIRWM